MPTIQKQLLSTIQKSTLNYECVSVKNFQSSPQCFKAPIRAAVRSDPDKREVIDFTKRVIGVYFAIKTTAKGAFPQLTFDQK